MVVGYVKNVAQKMTVVPNFAKTVEHTNKFNVRDIFLCLSLFNYTNKSFSDIVFQTVRKMSFHNISF